MSQQLSSSAMRKAFFKTVLILIGTFFSTAVIALSFPERATLDTAHLRQRSAIDRSMSLDSTGSYDSAYLSDVAHVTAPELESILNYIVARPAIEIFQDIGCLSIIPCYVMEDEGYETDIRAIHIRIHNPDNPDDTKDIALWRSRNWRYDSFCYSIDAHDFGGGSKPIDNIKNFLEPVQYIAIRTWDQSSTSLFREGPSEWGQWLSAAYKHAEIQRPLIGALRVRGLSFARMVYQYLVECRRVIRLAKGTSVEPQKIAEAALEAIAEKYHPQLIAALKEISTEDRPGYNASMAGKEVKRLAAKYDVPEEEVEILRFCFGFEYKQPSISERQDKEAKEVKVKAEIAQLRRNQKKLRERYDKWLNSLPPAYQSQPSSIAERMTQREQQLVKSINKFNDEIAILESILQRLTGIMSIERAADLLEAVIYSMRANIQKRRTRDKAIRVITDLRRGKINAGEAVSKLDNLGVDTRTWWVEHATAAVKRPDSSIPISISSTVSQISI